MQEKKLFFILLGCKPEGRHTEQHDVFISVGHSLADLIPDMETFWPASGKMHIDSWRAVTKVNEYTIKIIPRTASSSINPNKLFFLNLGGYKPGDPEEHHYKLLCVASDKSTAIAAAKKTSFFLHTGFEGANAHIDDKYGVDIDDIYEIEEILPEHIKSAYSIEISLAKNEMEEDPLHIGYLKLSSIK